MKPVSTNILTCGFALTAGFCKSPSVLWRSPSTLCRTLFTAQALGLDGYEKKRNQVKAQFAGLDDKFRAKMKEFSLPDSKNMIFTEDLKNMLHLVDDKPDEMVLITQMMAKFNSQNKNLRFGTFTFGPVIMRMYYHLNQPAEALAAFKNPSLDGLLDQLITAQILCDLLYNNQMYQDVLDVFELMKNKKIQGVTFPRQVSILAMASCYKLNNTESYEYALKILNDMKEMNIDTPRKVVAFAAMLALEQNAPQIALQILGAARRGNYVTLRNMKILALAALNRPDDALPIVRLSLERDTPGAEVKHTVCPDVLEKLSISVDRLGSKDVSLEYQRLHKALVEANLVSQDALTALLESEIDAMKEDVRFNQRGFQRDTINNRMNNQSGGFGQSMDFKPRRNPAYDRARMSIRHEY